MWNTNSGTWQVTEDLKFVSDPLLFGRHIVELRASDNVLVQSYVVGARSFWDDGWCRWSWWAVDDLQFPISNRYAFCGL